MTIGEKIRLGRNALELTQTAFGVKLGVKKNAVSKWECGRVDDIPSSKIKAMATMFNVPTSYLIDDEEKPTPVSEDGLDASEASLIELFRLVPSANRGMVLQMIEAALKSQGLI